VSSCAFVIAEFGEESDTGGKSLFAVLALIFNCVERREHMEGADLNHGLPPGIIRWLWMY
jgi:hypothetical protein